MEGKAGFNIHSCHLRLTRLGLRPSCHARWTSNLLENISRTCLAPSPLRPSISGSASRFLTTRQWRQRHGRLWSSTPLVIGALHHDSLRIGRANRRQRKWGGRTDVAAVYFLSMVPPLPQCSGFLTIQDSFRIFPSFEVERSIGQSRFGLGTAQVEGLVLWGRGF